ncbi:capping protein inhibiting regulator of actin dynamics-like [Anthonomus grandis grandis]|uniref:capping protein inhibiting regulator of actin dynamics-like n=1 Tax=Anthonomus grandis grandis TaxID=2921223 RepID=UPI002165FDD2|nr:capping protein inhibiting regulator of actin dynamics-like [Anthonomus grandis grandis]
MLENRPRTSHCGALSWTIDEEFPRENQRVVRKFINSAIYVEKEIREMPVQRKTSPLTSNVEEEEEREVEGGVKVDVTKCPTMSLYKRSSSHDTLKTKQSPESGYRTHETSLTSSKAPSESSFITVKEKDDTFGSDLRLSLSCLHTNRTCVLDPKEKQEIVQTWMAKKEREKRRRQMKEARIEKEREEERQRLIEKERENFKRWLQEKKKEEEQRKLQKELEEEEMKLREVQKEKRKVENDISFNLWLRRKRKDDLEKRITEKIALLRVYEEKQRRLEENERAYQGWLETSKNRQKPVPMNKGLQSLCSSASVTYINPIPWTPNIDSNNKKMASQ